MPAPRNALARITDEYRAIAAMTPPGTEGERANWDTLRLKAPDAMNRLAKKEGSPESDANRTFVNDFGLNYPDMMVAAGNYLSSPHAVDQGDGGPVASYEDYLHDERAKTRNAEFRRGGSSLANKILSLLIPGAAAMKLRSVLPAVGIMAGSGYGRAVEASPGQRGLDALLGGVSGMVPGVAGRAIGRKMYQRAREDAHGEAQEFRNITRHEMRAINSPMIEFTHKTTGARVHVVYSVEGNRAKIGYIGSNNKTLQGKPQGSFGVSGLRQLREEIRKRHPGVNTFYGDRVSGARERWGADRKQSVLIPGLAAALSIPTRDAFDRSK